MIEREPAPQLAFQWRDREHPGWRLLFWLFATLLATAFFFLLFQVVYPQPRHVVTTPHRVLMLDSADPTTRHLVSRSLDQNFLLLGATVGETPAAGRLTNSFPVFQPSFAGFELRLAELPRPAERESLPRVFGNAQLPLPPPATVMKAQPTQGEARQPSRPAQVVRAVLSKELAGRQLLSARELPGTKLVETARPRFKIGVSAQGAVAFALPLTAIEDRRLADDLQRFVSRLRFKPAAADVQWGEIAFQWEEQTP